MMARRRLRLASLFVWVVSMLASVLALAAFATGRL